MALTEPLMNVQPLRCKKKRKEKKSPEEMHNSNTRPTDDWVTQGQYISLHWYSWMFCFVFFVFLNHFRCVLKLLPGVGSRRRGKSNRGAVRLRGGPFRLFCRRLLTGVLIRSHGGAWLHPPPLRRR